MLDYVKKYLYKNKYYYIMNLINKINTFHKNVYFILYNKFIIEILYISFFKTFIPTKYNYIFYLVCYNYLIINLKSL